MATTKIDIQRILCPVDFSEFSGPALERAVRLSDWFEARIEVLHVIPFLPLAMPVGVFEVTPQQRRQVDEAMSALVEPFREEGAPIVTKVLEGDPWRAILAEATAVRADLLVIGTHGRSGFEKLLLGSVTEKVLRRAPCPVLTVGHVPAHSRKGPLFRRILCAADLTQASQQTLDMALALATENDAQITLLHVMETLSGNNAAALMTGAREAIPPQLLASARADLRKAVSDRVRAFCDVTERVETGAPWTEILRVAEQMDAELIVMGAHATGAVGRMLFGATTNHVVRRAHCPVLIVHESLKPLPAAETAGVVSVAGGRGRDEADEKREVGSVQQRGI